jgi:hypothetical protein
VIEAGANDLLLHVTEFAVILGMFVMLFGLLVPHAVEPVAETAHLDGTEASASLAKIVAAGSATAQAMGQASAPAEVIPNSTFAAIIAEAKRQVDDQEFIQTETHHVEKQAIETHASEQTAVETTESGFDIDEMLNTTTVSTTVTTTVEESVQSAVVSTPEMKGVLAQRITWPTLVDPEIEANCDLPTRLRLIEALSFIGGTWSVDILARAYEQELDANVRGAIFVALRDARSVA